MTITRTADEIIIRLPSNVEVDTLQDWFDLIRYRELTAGIKVSQEDFDALMEEVKASRRLKRNQQ